LSFIFEGIKNLKKKFLELVSDIEVDLNSMVRQYMQLERFKTMIYKRYKGKYKTHPTLGDRIERIKKRRIFWR